MPNQNYLKWMAESTASAWWHDSAVTEEVYKAMDRGIPVGINQDGAMGAVDAKALLDYGTDRFGMYMPIHLTAWGSSQMCVLLSYMTIPFIHIFGFNVITIRLPMLIVSFAGMIVYYLFCQEVYNRKLL